LASPGTQYVSVGEQFSYTLQATQGAIKNYYFTGIPDGIIRSDMTLAGSPARAGVYTITMYASNDCGVGNTSFQIISDEEQTSSVALSSVPDTGTFTGIDGGIVALYGFVLMMASGAIVLLALGPIQSLFPQKKTAYVRRKRRS